MMEENNEKIKSKKRNRSKILIFLLLLVVSLGFAYLTSNLSMFGSSILKGQKWDVHFENVQVSSEGIQIKKPQIIDKTTVEYNVTLDKPGDFVEFTVDAKNDGTIDAMISTLDGIKIYEVDSETPLDSIPDYLEYSVTYADYEDVPIAEKHLLKSGDKATYKVHVEYKKDITKDNLVDSKKELKAEFDVEYVQADENAISYNQLLSTNSTLSKEKLYSFGEANKPTQLAILSTGVSNFNDEKYVDISEEQDKSILAWMDEEIMYVSAKEKGLYIKAPEDSSYLLGLDYLTLDYDNYEPDWENYKEPPAIDWITNLEKIDLSKLDTSKVTNMTKMFKNAGYNLETSLNIDLGEWDTSSVTSMESIFENVGQSAKIFNLRGLNNWDTSKVTNMNWMFGKTGYNAEEWSIGDLNSWDTGNVQNMSGMFYYAGQKATKWSIGDISNWDTSNVTNMFWMFCDAGEYTTIFELDLSGWDTSKVKDMDSMFSYTGRASEVFKLEGLKNWDVSSVTDMDHMFWVVGDYATTFKLDLSGWNTGNVTNMDHMFMSAGGGATTFELDLTGWNTSKVKNMNSMFCNAGDSATVWSIKGLEGWNTSSVTDMTSMFRYAGYKASYYLDLSGWNVSSVLSYKHDEFNMAVTSKVKSPKWVK